MKEYIVKYVNSSLLKVERKGMSSLQEKASVITDFSYPWEEVEAPKISFRALWDDDFLYFRYDVEGSIILASFKELSLLENNQLEAGLYRGYCMKFPTSNNACNLRWISWEQANSKEPDFHIPSSFGKFKLENSFNIYDKCKTC